MEQGQFVFDRSAGGKLASLLKIPDRYGFTPTGGVEFECNEFENVQICIKDGGYNRVGNERWPFALLLNLIRVRYWPDLNVQDDFQEFEYVGRMLSKYRMLSIMRDEKNDFDACWHLAYAMERWGERAEWVPLRSLKPFVEPYPHVETAPGPERDLRPVQDNVEMSRLTSSN